MWGAFNWLDSRKSLGVLVNAVMGLQVPWNPGYCFAIGKTISFWRTTAGQSKLYQTQVKVTNYNWTSFGNGRPCAEQMDMVTKPTSAQKSIILYHLINIVWLVHVSTTLVVIIREVHHKGRIYRYITNFVNQC
jgi:hypothetical protein